MTENNDTRQSTQTSSTSHLAVCRREFDTLLDLFMLTPQLSIKPVSELGRVPTFKEAPAAVREACAAVQRSRANAQDAQQTEMTAWESLPWKTGIARIQDAQAKDRTNRFVVRLGRWGELASELILAMPAITDHPERIVAALQIAALMDDDGFVRRSTRKRFHLPIDDKPVGIYKCKACYAYRDFRLVDTDAEDPHFAIQCSQCTFTIPGSYTTVRMWPGGQAVRTYDTPFVSDSHYLIAHERMRDRESWAGRHEPLPGAPLIEDDGGANLLADC